MCFLVGCSKGDAYVIVDNKLVRCDFYKYYINKIGGDYLVTYTIDGETYSEFLYENRLYFLSKDELNKMGKR